MLGDFLFEIITKILIVQLAGVADKIVSHNQFGFIKCWQIHDFIALA